MSVHAQRSPKKLSTAKTTTTAPTSQMMLFIMLSHSRELGSAILSKRPRCVFVPCAASGQARWGRRPSDRWEMVTSQARTSSAGFATSAAMTASSRSACSVAIFARVAAVSRGVHPCASEAATKTLNAASSATSQLIARSGLPSGKMGGSTVWDIQWKLQTDERFRRSATIELSVRPSAHPPTSPVGPPGRAGTF